MKAIILSMIIGMAIMIIIVLLATILLIVICIKQSPYNKAVDVIMEKENKSHEWSI